MATECNVEAPTYINPTYQNDDHKVASAQNKPAQPNPTARSQTYALDDNKKKAAHRVSKTCIIVTLGICVVVVVVVVVLLVKYDFFRKKTGIENKNCPNVNETTTRKPPHIVFFLADDLGWYDVGYNNPEMLTPNMDRLAAEGVIFNQAYSNPMCTPSRASLMSGYYTFKTGLQHAVIQTLSPYGLPTNFTLLPQELKSLGYTNHMIGKWHLGMCKEAFLPINRGFDSFYGFLNSYIDYYAHTNQDLIGIIEDIYEEGVGHYSGYDFWDNAGMVLDKTTHISYLLSKRAEELIDKHNKDMPMFLYYSSPLPHFYLQVPEEYENLYPNHRNRNRRAYNGMVSMMDEIIGNLTNKLMEKGMWENTLFVFMSDNGGTPNFGGFNYPLRGAKGTLFEGGERVVTFAAGGLLEKRRYVNDGLMHITDWYPTFLSVAGGTPDPDMDGMNIWDVISKGKESPRDEIVYIDEILGGAAIRVGDWKLIEGNHQMFYPTVYDQDDWYLPPTGVNETVVSPVYFPPPNDTTGMPEQPDVLYLFNLKDDPNERDDLSANETEIVTQLQTRLDNHRRRLMPALHVPSDLSADPALNDGVYRTDFC